MLMGFVARSSDSELLCPTSLGPRWAALKGEPELSTSVHLAPLPDGGCSVS